MAKIMVTGATGLLGRAVVSQLSKTGEHRLIATGFSRAADDIYKLDLTCEVDVEGFISSNRPDVIIHCAAERRPDISANDPQATKALNVDATSVLAGAAKQHNAWLLYISTDYVFDGTSPTYSETERPNPLNFYGESKWYGEQVLLEACEDFAVLRVPILYGRVENVEESAILVLLRQLLNSQAQNIDHWAIRSPTSTKDIAIAIEQMLALHLEHSPLTGIYHFSGKQTMTKYQMLLNLADILQLSATHLSPVTEPSQSVKRPRDCTLSCRRLSRLGIASIIEFREGITDSLLHSQQALSLLGLSAEQITDLET